MTTKIESTHFEIFNIWFDKFKEEIEERIEKFNEDLHELAEKKRDLTNELNVLESQIHYYEEMKNSILDFMQWKGGIE